MIVDQTPVPDGRRPPEPLTEESIGALLTAARAATGRSQLRVAELLCAASGNPTLTRHEVSRWEREERIPGGYWLPWLALVLEVPLDALERAAAQARSRRAGAAPGWSAARLTVTGIAALRRADDLTGGVDLAPYVMRELRDLDRARHPALVADAAQLAGWVLTDAGEHRRALAAHRLGLRAAAAARDESTAGHLLTAAAYLELTGGGPHRALRLALTGYARARARSSDGARCVLLHRVAYAAARAGEAAECARALAAADLAYDRRTPGDDPAWARWLDDAALAALAGRCYLALGQRRTCEPLLARALAGPLPPRARALCTGWLAAAHLAGGEAERASALAAEALLDAVRLGSVRVLDQVRTVAAGLATRRAGGARLHAQLDEEFNALLPRRPLSFAGPGAAGFAGPGAAGFAGPDAAGGHSTIVAGCG
jgi:transcriptional regulator with XRE-family HTH domain